MKKILLIATGGTIASSESKDGLTPTIDVKQLVSYIPEVTSLCDLKGLSLMSIDSTNMNPKLMTEIARSIYQAYPDYDGFVISHGTDTMAYTAAALSYMLQNLNKPVVLTGSQLPIEAEHTDAKKNLSDAIRFACEDVKGVFVAFHGLIINGTHAMKMKTISADAFWSINAPIVAAIQSGEISYHSESNHSEANHSEANHSYLSRSALLQQAPPSNTDSFSIAANLCEDILIIKMFPGIQPKLFDFVKENYKGVIIEGFGIGGIPNEDPDIVAKIQELIEAGIAVVITTQCLYEGIDLSVYEVGQMLAKQNVILGGRMTTEALTMKLMWALGNYQNLKDIKAFIEDEGALK